MPLAVFNTKNHTLRELVVVPSRRWAGEGLLGLTIRFDSFKGADEHMLHVLEVTRDGPADIAGLQPLDDYLLGTAEKVKGGVSSSPLVPTSNPLPPSSPTRRYSAIQRCWRPS
ncbi:hypothetical protein EON64_16380 [archaeon]|nr:MAG: hypothetical protein EON64_16380 [archaeon]